MCTMGWILQCILVTLTTTTAYDYSNPYYYGLIQPRRSFHESQERGERMNERSISVSSGIQRVQDKERRRVDSYSDEPVPRSENGTYKIVNNSPLEYTSFATRRGASPDSVVFPGRTSAGAFKLNIPPECEKLGICVNLPDYPEDLVNNIIAKLPKEKLDLLRVDKPEPEIAQRLGPGDSEEIELCGHREENFLRPLAQKDIFENWQLILNDRSNPLQGYRVEICLEPGTSCATNVAFFYDGYSSMCKQKYSQRLLATVDQKTGEPVFNVPFKVPTCCTCVAIHTTGN